MSAAGPEDCGPAALRALTKSADLVDSLYLVRNGVPFDVAFSLEEAERRAWIVVIGELDGMAWDWGAMQWRT